MIQVFEGQNHAEAGFVCGLLHAEGIEAVLRGDTLFSIVGAGPQVPGVLPTVWILRAEQEARARAAVVRYREEGRARESGAGWACPACAEPHEPQFTSCWKCGAERPQG